MEHDMTGKAWDTPPSLWMNGRIVPWKECLVHVTSGYAQRGASVFEGIRVYRAFSSGVYLALAFAEHLERLENTWRALSLPLSYPNHLIRQAVIDLLGTRKMTDSYCRVTRFLDLPSKEDTSEADGLIVALYQVPPLIRKPVTCITSSWRRNAFALPAQMKIGGHYFMLSWVRQQARKLGADDAILLNHDDFVCEATGTAVFLWMEGYLVTPPVSDCALPSITARIVVRLANELGIPTSIRSIHRTELFQARCAFLAGTLDELRPITRIDEVQLNTCESEPIHTLFEAFASICRDERSRKWGEVFESFG
jgi:branched-chain amino acid aminotransferase